ncbi:hypothetical protein SAMD00019534_062840 [Acytostelium subglobosum LB1]|uniref:hypothetical protein n=1 Tax=Acytostelium subglobosum LB1 TaxID=1410327 RepID=UPI0006449659|nr:hypothetical protein SAMD00019534_062840 [Acytostelium subglobosum LB1]GAM23109.1 hypothetical protein SAMD00019534_062840 [Acytostelium subglobosum LB1]|eukprot:XP_012754336.1 hypothetical protein SAMD00019534_062840 [Acytostelium subglobosum LB1]
MSTQVKQQQSAIIQQQKETITQYSSSPTSGSSSSSSMTPSVSSCSLPLIHQWSESEERYTDTSFFPLPIRFDKLIPLSERYITHSYFQRHNGSSSFIGLLTNARFYKVDPDTNKKNWSIDLIDVVAVEGDDLVDPRVLRIVYHIRDGGAANGAGNEYDAEVSPPNSPLNSSSGGSGYHRQTLKRRASFSSPGSSASNGDNGAPWAEKILMAESEDDRDHWLIAMRFLVRNLFQKQFEAAILPAPEVYQLHLYVHKSSRKGKSQVKCMLLSTERLYCLSVKHSWAMGKVKWSVPYSALKGLQISKINCNQLVVTLDNKDNTKLKDVQQFTMRDVFERNMFLNELRRLYNKTTKTHLPREEKEETVPRRASTRK